MCVVNKNINGKQCTMLWHVDDLKISHFMPKTVTKVIKQLEKKFGKLQVTRGKAHDCLGMTLDHASPGKVKIIMTQHIEDTVAEFPEDITGEVASPAPTHLFSVNDECPKLSTEKAEAFHAAVAKCLWIGKRGRPDIQTPVLFLTTRVR